MRRSISRRLLLGFAAILSIYSVVFVSLNLMTIGEFRRESFRIRVAELEALGELARCDADPAGWGRPDEGMGGVFAVAADGQVLNPRAPLRQAPPPPDAPGAFRGFYTPGLSWTAVYRAPHGGPCATLLVVQEQWMGFGSKFFLMLSSLRVVMGFALAAGLWMLLVRPLVDRIRALAGRTRAVVASDFQGQLADPNDDELGALARAFDQATRAARERLDELVARDRSAREIVANIAHDVRTPMAALRLALERLVRRAPSEETRVALGELAYLDALTRNLQALVALESATLPSPARPLDLGDTLNRVRARFEMLAESRGVRLHVAGRATLTGDAVALEQAISNLVHNAVDFASENVAVLCREDPGGRVRVEVRDDGPGPPTTELPELSARYFRGSVSVKRGRRGQGLGLAIADEVARRHGGRLQIERAAEVTVARLLLLADGQRSDAPPTQPGQA
ncbi:MAG: HAMP domain-containing histidine kinase [Alphaproteobacteria bacterium]|nr:HAMP domain-containing histidine kinase [Alphaproteobacteria bacterium]